MKLKTIEELRNLKDEDLSSEIKISEKELYSVKMKLELNTLKETHLVKELRRYVAKIKTVASERNIILK